jgi:hypothetical protein
VNYDAALKVVDEWLERLNEYAEIRNGVGIPDRFEKMAIHDRWFNERLPLVQSISLKLYPTAKNAVSRWAGASKVPWLGTKDHLLQVRGFLSQRDDYRAVFTPQGPRLSASALHPWVWDAAKHLWSQGHHRNAVGNAATQLEVILQNKLGRSDVSGAALVGEAFSLNEPKPGRPRLRFVELNTASERFRSAHIGALHLGQGCFEGIRNWAAHTVDEKDEQTALEYLAAFSVFARWVDQAEVVAAVSSYPSL